MTEEKIKYALIGVAVFLFVKYKVVGFDKWNAAFHPERLSVESGRGMFG